MSLSVAKTSGLLSNSILGRVRLFLSLVKNWTQIHSIHNIWPFKHTFYTVNMQVILYCLSGKVFIFQSLVVGSNPASTHQDGSCLNLWTAIWKGPVFATTINKHRMFKKILSEFPFSQFLNPSLNLLSPVFDMCMSLQKPYIKYLNCKIHSMYT